MRLVFFGSGAFGLPTLESLSKRHQILTVVTQPDRPAGRGSKLTPTPIASWAAEHLPGVPLIKPAKVNDPQVVAQIRAFPADAWVVIAFGQKLGRALLQDKFAINLHASLLPRWRGAAPINAAIFAGDAETGNSVIALADRMDAGDILAQSHRPIDPSFTTGELHDLLAADGPPLVESVLTSNTTATLKPVKQDESLATLAPKLTKSDRRIDFRQPAELIRRRVHAMTPWPGISVEFPGAVPAVIKLLRVQPAPQSHQQPEGTLIDPTHGSITCGDSTVLRVVEVQPPGKRPMPWQDFIRGAGRSLQPGAHLASPQEPA